jgi:hypothetical protein
VPEEFAAAYREAYRRALESGPGADVRADAFADPALDLPEVPPQEVVRVGIHRSEEASPESERAGAGWRASRWFTPALLAVGAVLLVIAAYGIGAALAGDGADPPGSVDPGTGTTTDPEPTDEPSDVRPTAKPSSTAGGWKGEVTPVTVDAISADCTATPSNDSAGRRVTYVPENAIDGETQTAWRCSGDGVGQTLTLRLAGDADVAEVGLVPGYAKTDPESGVDRYAENNRITKVRWTLADGVRVVQRLDPDPSSREMQLLRVPRTTTDTLRLEVLAVRKGPRNTTAISEISLSAAQ